MSILQAIRKRVSSTRLTLVPLAWGFLVSGESPAKHLGVW